MAEQTFSACDYRYMARALQLARHGRYSTQPNPHVGCVIVNGGKIVGEGFHRKAGEAHAEINALRMAGEQARGATVYVTLEPCSHHGRTPPCSERLLAAGVGRVVFATGDVSPKVAGQGATLLRSNGISVSSGLMASQARELNRGFFTRHEKGRPFVTIKIAMTLDAKIGLRSGESQWITGPEARADVQRMRARSCAIVTGRGTVQADNPRLSVRDQSLQTLGRQPAVVVLDSQLALKGDYEVFRTSADCIIMHCADSEAVVPGVRTQKVARRGDTIDLNDVLVRLAKLEYNEVMVEAGPTLSSAFVANDLWDELVVFMAPKVIGANGREGFVLPAINNLDDATAVKLQEVRHVGNDLRLSYARFFD